MGEQLKCPKCEGINIDVYDDEVQEKDILCGILNIECFCECMDCHEEYRAIAYFGIGDIEY